VRLCGDEGKEVGVAFCMVEKAAVVGGPVLRHPVEMLAEASVEALDHAVGLRPEGLREAVGDGALGADPVEGVVVRALVLGFCLLVDGEAVGELGAVVGQDGVDFEREAVKEARARDPAAVVARRSGRIFRDRQSGWRDRSRHRRRCAGGRAAAGI
jgi:hypothetical protein